MASGPARKFREIKNYEIPLGVGILREVSRNAFKLKVRKFNSLREAMEDMQTRMLTPIENYVDRSKVIEEYTTQNTLKNFF